MKTYNELQTICISYTEICEGETPWVPLGNFMNDFFGNFTDQRFALVKDPLQEPANPTPEMQKWAVFCAASVEYLCQKYHLPCPSWVYNPSYTLLEPWFHSPAAAHKPHIRERLLRETPPEFAKRNVYCGNRVFANKYELADERRRSA